MAGKRRGIKVVQPQSRVEKVVQLPEAASLRPADGGRVVIPHVGDQSGRSVLRRKGFQPGEQRAADAAAP